MKQPVTYKEWRNIYHKELRKLGMFCECVLIIKSNRFRIKRSSYYLYTLLHRIKRIRNRMQACTTDPEGDVTYSQTILDLIGHFRKKT